ncbi:hypothetical protein BaRGS_00009459 [Batillaria attramentaria]|uniref:Ig-like domain-containing protein n=1 Tax=Batillaria attramentaria TaxID=370345 RepID=A0ABD0LI70_9CAEN
MVPSSQSATSDFLRFSLSSTAPPETDSGVLTVTQNRRVAVQDHVTGTWRVQLTCGLFTDLGEPPVHVVWKTPSGTSLLSTNYESGNFHLLLENPVVGGNYSCSLNNSPAAACLHGEDPMLREVTVYVDEMQARLTLIEAHQRALESGLKTENANLTQHVQGLETQLNQYHRDNMNLTDQLNQYHRDNMNVTYQLNQYHRDNMNVTDQLNQYHKDNMNLTDQLNQYHRDNMNLADQLNQYHRDNMNVTYQLNQYHRDNMNVTDQLNQYHKDNMNLTDQLNQYHRDNMNLADQLNHITETT